MASFQAKIGWKMLRKRRNKNCISVPFIPDGQQKIKKKQKIKSLTKRENKNCRFVSFPPNV